MSNTSNFLYINTPQASNSASEIEILKNKLSLMESFIAENDQFLDFSQLGEQKVLINILERLCQNHQLSQIYLDIGGFHPVIGSNTFRLYLRHGWKGVIVEPNPEKLQNWSSIRPNDVTICAAAIPDTWNQDTVRMICSSNSDARESVDRTLNINNRQSIEGGTFNYDAKTIRLSDLMNQCASLNLLPTLLNLDIEGLEESIIIDSKAAKYKIPLLCIEHFLNEFTADQSILAYQQSNLVRYLERSGYYLVSVCGISLIFCHKEFWVPYG